ncbi:MAG: hypothetical protein ACK5MR_10135 [Cumulibacter sp.]
MKCYKRNSSTLKNKFTNLKYDHNTSNEYDLSIDDHFIKVKVLEDNSSRAYLENLVRISPKGGTPYDSIKAIIAIIEYRESLDR